MPLRSTRPGRYVAIASMAVAVSSLASGAVVLERWLRVGGSSRHDDALRGLDLLTLLGLGGAALVFAVFTGLVRPAIVAWSRRTRTEGEREASVRIDRRYREQLHALGDAMTQMAAVHARSREELGTETEGRVRAIEQLRHADRMRTVGALASGLAHELGTPLNVVEGHARLMLASPRLGPELREGAQAIADQSVKMTRLVKHLITFARRRGPSKEPTDMSALVGTTLAMLSTYAKQRGVTVLLEDPGDLELSVDASTMQQVLTNLIVNAIQATPPGAAPILVEVVAPRVLEPPMGEGRGEGAYAVIRVTDHGGGIAREDLGHIFEPFFTTRDVGEGMGLGLSVAHGIVQDHGGWISAASEPGATTVIEVTLPAFRTRESAWPRDRASVTPPPAAISSAAR